MTKAQEMRVITNKAQEIRDNAKFKENEKFANKVINGKCRCAAALGCATVKVRVPKKYSPSLVEQVFINEGFTTARESKNGKQILKIKW